ncbi:hypothetical protein C2E21_6277 [Chlorella sorokiniana]|uniref:Uncharacterized protein n=1 Tax=Chlorella sorokiniana TaxID=3076 RepID=A0A2P6TLT8_CHLSO|nr:hypothetical protein C2E21_6277 [Chlorella sorokiniana]|eukprot:PRW45206.1 hypothetical protein C2E21_6277 [Chlorella sorokiniana]
MLLARAAAPGATQTSLQRSPALPVQRYRAGRRPLFRAAAAASPPGGPAEGSSNVSTDGSKQSPAAAPAPLWLHWLQWPQRLALRVQQERQEEEARQQRQQQEAARRQQEEAARQQFGGGGGAAARRPC